MSLRDVLDALAERTKGHGGEGFLSLSMHSPSVTPANVERLCRAYIEGRGWRWWLEKDSARALHPYYAEVGPGYAATGDTPAKALGRALLRALDGGEG